MIILQTWLFYKSVTVSSNLEGSKSQEFSSPLAPTMVEPTGETVVAGSL